MAKKFKEMSPEQQRKWLDYNSSYSKANYRSFNVKLSYEKDKDILAYVEGKPFATIVREAIRFYIDNKNS